MQRFLRPAELAGRFETQILALGGGTVTSVLVMLETCERLQRELESGTLDEMRLREIETILRLLVPQVIRALADAVQRMGERPDLSDAGKSLMSGRACLERVAAERSAETDKTRYTLNRAAGHIVAVLGVLEAL